MSTDHPNERDAVDSRSDATTNRPPAFRPNGGLRPPTTLLGNLLDVSVRASRRPSATRVGTSPDRNWLGRHQRKGGPNRERCARVRTPGSGDVLIETRFDGDTFVVNADLPGATTGDLTVGIDTRTNALVIARDGTVRERVALPWRSPEPTRVWLNNGILEVRLRPHET